MKPLRDADRKPVRLGTFAVAAMLMALAMPGVSPAQTAEPAKVAPAFREELPNVPGKSLVGVIVEYAPGGKTPPHRHARSAFVVGYVLSGAIRSQVDGGPVQVFNAGESWSETPGARHDVSENASATEPAKLLAIFVVDTEDRELTTQEQRRTGP